MRCTYRERWSLGGRAADVHLLAWWTFEKQFAARALPYILCVGQYRVAELLSQGLSTVKAGRPRPRDATSSIGRPSETAGLVPAVFMTAPLLLKLH